MKKYLLVSIFSLLAFVSVSASNAEEESFFPSHCSNYGSTVSLSFTNCINSNFRRLTFDLPREFFSYCNNFGDDLSFSFESCVNNNFNKVERSLGLFLSHCMNFGDGVSFSYQSCINSNFREIQYELRRQ
ncbi:MULTISPECIES: hypothetical protein [Halobacteriovorax]|uniref:Uncharacterized protein n=2 Tax=Halobacteriovorax TaxID=1652133 RepID=A0ABY0IGN7_9BACT|nr:MULTISPECIES: hypothetical protein [Halobacteriovorax]RZF22105.1 hypothetical protein DAY19_10510 [Halobacteriovorax vibrionivorans]TGD46934.1 hypothetical protein EP118_09895 [Halobacteriovorax sp. Y22]